MKLNLSMKKTRALKEEYLRAAEKFDIVEDLERLKEVEREARHWPEGSKSQDKLLDELMQLRQAQGLASYYKAEYERAYWAMPKFLRKSYREKYGR